MVLEERTKLQQLQKQKVERIEEKILEIKGELVIGGFIAYKDTIKNWESPYENELIDDTLKQKIIDMVTNETKNSHLVIIFE